MKRALLLLASLALVGCGLTGEPLPTGPINACSEDADCGSARCDLDRGLCVAVEVDDLDVYLDVIPPSSFGSSDSFGPYPLDALRSLDLRLSAPVRVEGTVRYGSLPIRAQVRFRPTDVPLPERAARIITQTFDPALPDHPQTYDFEVELVPGRSYTVRIEPEGADRALYPPLRGMLELGADGQHIDIAYLADDLVSVVGDVSSLGGVPEDGLEVTAIDAATGEVLSSVGTTGSDPESPGAFEIRMLRGAPAWLLRLAPARDRTGVFPTFVVDPSYLTTLVPPGTDIERAQVLVPTIASAVRFAGTVEYPASIAVAQPVEGAVVTMRAEIVDATTNMQGSIELTFVTDAMGRFDGSILPGIYEIQASSVSNPRLGILLERRELRPAAGATELLGSVLSLPARSLLGGVAQAPGAEPLPDTTVRAIATGLPLDGLSDPELARRARSTDGVTDAAGEFRLDLDVGIFDLVVEPSAGSGYPWWIETGVGIGGSDRPINRVAELRAPVAVDGTLEGYEGDRIAGAEIYAYTRHEGRLIAIGRVTTDAEGELHLLLPPTL